MFSGGCWLCGGPVAVGNGSVRGLCGSGSLSDEEEDEESEDEEDDDCVVLSGGRSPSGSSGARLAVLTGRSREPVARCCGRLLPVSVSIGGGSSTCI